MFISERIGTATRTREWTSINFHQKLGHLCEHKVSWHVHPETQGERSDLPSTGTFESPCSTTWNFHTGTRKGVFGKINPWSSSMLTEGQKYWVMRGRNQRTRDIQKSNLTVVDKMATGCHLVECQTRIPVGRASAPDGPHRITSQHHHGA